MAPDAPAWLGQVPAVETLRRVWVQQFAVDAGRVRWRTEADGVPPARLFISSPYDVEARLGKKDTTTWVGYKVHLTETCEDEAPHLIVHVATTPAPVADGDVTPAIHEELRGADLLPGKHAVDTAYVDAELLVTSRREYGVDLIGPTRPDYRWQSKAGEGFAARDFTIDWEREQATCPEGRTSVSWTPAVDRGHNEVIKIKFSAKDCGTCPARARCTEAKRRSITIRPRDQYEALQAARSRESSAGVSGRIPPACGDRGDDLAGGTGVRPSPCALRRGGESPPAARRHGDGDQRGPDHGLVGGSPARGDEDVRLHEVDGRLGRGVRNSPAVSKVRENRKRDPP